MTDWRGDNHVKNLGFKLKSFTTKKNHFFLARHVSRAIVQSCSYTKHCLFNRLFMSKPTIDQLEAILASEEDVPIEILPNGEVRAKGQTTSAELGGKKPLTMRENLGGEYGKELF
jgi:hypothetical protein